MPSRGPPRRLAMRAASISCTQAGAGRVLGVDDILLLTRYVLLGPTTTAQRRKLLGSGAVCDELVPAQNKRGIQNVVRQTRAVLIRQNREDQLHPVRPSRRAAQKTKEYANDHADDELQTMMALVFG